MRRTLDLFRPRDPATDAMAALIAALVLTGLGIICVYSFGGAHVVRQAVWAVLGVFVCIGISRVPTRLLRKAAGPALIAAGLLLLGALLFAPRIENTRRWLVIGSFGFFQPSEFAKLAVVLFLADRLSRRQERVSIRMAWPVGVICVLVVLAPDLGTTAFLAAVAFALLLIAGARLRGVLTGAAIVLPALALVASQYPYMKDRLQFFRGVRNFQQDQALVALGSGGFMGNGLGAGRQKMEYLPAGHTDFVLPNVGEELGFIGVALVVALFALIAIHGLRVALAASKRDGFGFYLACGATFLVVFQAVVNIAVATAAAPTKGISLPFLSQGGSNLFMALIAIGLIVQVGRTTESRA
ncbi:MAG: FtsW/RodA/SpoVE family cell cycle protein [Planctomycetota bacterium]|nr:FtsW/RodA/SpoVE family cell cycle protein [Planctomycetota bacterium]